METLKSFFAGWIGGAGLIITGQPFDTIKTRLQSTPGLYTGTLDCVRKTVQADGPLSLYAGAKPLILGIGPVFALYFAAYDAAEQLLRSIQRKPTSESLTLPQVMFCGASTGFVGSLILGPAELIKVRCQISMKPAGEVCRTILQTDGARGFTRGLLATIVRDVPASAAWFGTYEVMKAHYQKGGQSITTVQSLFAGGCAGIMNWVVCLPLDSVKTLTQGSGGKPISWAEGFSTILRQSGVRGFYRGVVPIMLRAFPANAACFACKEAAMNFFDSLDGSAERKAAAKLAAAQ